MSETTCVRECIDLRRHTSECDSEDCRGCRPRKAEHGLLCETCHLTLRDILRFAPGQVALLRAVVEPSSQQRLNAETKPVQRNPIRLSSGGPEYIAPATGTPSAGASEPIRLAALDVAAEYDDVLSVIVEALAADYQINRPTARAAGTDRAPKDPDKRRRRWHPVEAGQTPYGRWERVKVYHGQNGGIEMGQYVWTDPPDVYTTSAAAAWLMDNLVRLEHQPAIGDDLEVLADLASRAHALAPWREQTTRLPGIACPSCQRMDLMRFGGSDNVQCNTCHKAYPWERYAIWVRMYLEHKDAG